MSQNPSPKSPAPLPDPPVSPGRWTPPPLGESVKGRAPQPQPAAPEQPPRPDPRWANAYAMGRAKKLAAELASRRVEALAMFEPLKHQAAFFASKARYRLARGSNRSGKTLCAAIEVARALCGSDPYGKYPRESGVIYAVGKDLSHIGKVMYPKLFRSTAASGGMKMIRDHKTRAWRAYRPWEEPHREAEAKYAPPLVPPRMVLEVAWENKKENVPSLVRLKNGWEIHFFSSLGKPPKGAPIDLFWFDEEVVDPEWYPEMAARIVDRRGRGIWSFTPEEGTEQAWELHERGERERATLPEENRSVMEYEFLLSDNAHLDQAAKEALAADLTEEKRLVKVGGQYALMGYRVYPTFSTLVHGYPAGEVPPHWTRYAYTDPGYRVCGVLFCAVPPQDEGDFVLVYDELYIQECDAEAYGLAMKRKTAEAGFEAFLIDMHMAIHTELGVGRNVLEQYSAALARHGVKSVTTGSGFLFASDDVMAGILAVQGMLRVRPDGTPRLRVMRERCPNLESELKRYHRRRVKGEVQNEPDQRRANHLCDCLRYLALHEPRHVRRDPRPAEDSWALRRLAQKQEKQDRAHGGRFVNLGPGGGRAF